MVIPEPLLDYRSSETSLWRVTKKMEYEEAHDEQIVDNVSYYTGGTCELTPHEIQFLRGSTSSLLALNDKKRILVAFQKLAAITASFLSHDITRHTNRVQLREAALQYKIRLMEKLAKKLKQHELFGLLVRLGDWRVLCHFFTKKMGRTPGRRRYLVGVGHSRPSLEGRVNK